MNLLLPFYNDPLTHHELISITAVVEYLANKKGSKTSGTYNCLAEEFGVSDVKLIKRRDYDEAIKFLVDLDGMNLN